MTVGVMALPRAKVGVRKRRRPRPPRGPWPWWWYVGCVAFDVGGIIRDVVRLGQDIVSGHAVDPMLPMAVLVMLVNARLMLGWWGKWR